MVCRKRMDQGYLVPPGCLDLLEVLECLSMVFLPGFECFLVIVFWF